MTGFNVWELAVVWPEIFLTLLAMTLLMYGAFRGNHATPVVYGAALMGLIVAIHLVLQLPSRPAGVLNGMLSSTAFTTYAKLLVLGGGLMTLLITGGWLDREQHRRFEYPVLFLLAIVGMMLMVSASSLMSLYMGLELSSLSLYVLASFHRDNAKSTEAGLKYFVLGALASGMMLFGSSLVYGFAGSLSFDAIATMYDPALPQIAGVEAAQPTIGVTIGLVLVIIGFCFKVSAAPFHMWTPDVYEGAPTPVTAFFAVAPKIAALALFMRVLVGPFESMVVQWQQVIIFASILSMLVGAFGALTQTNIKRLLAYSSIGHIGYALMGIAAGTPEGMQGVLIYLSIYLFMNVGAFTIVLLMIRDGEYVEELKDLAGLSTSRPALALLLSVFMFSMAGIPPLAGFFGKFYVFMAAIESGLIILAVVGLLSSVVACFYYIKIVKLMYFDEAAAPFDAGTAPTMRLVLGVTAGFTLLFFLVPSPLVNSAKQAAEALLL